MGKTDELYVEGFKEWLNEMNAHTERLKLSIKTAEKIKQSNEKQLALHRERTNIYIEEFNAWAKEHDVEPIGLM